LEDELDEYEARRYFGLPGRAVPESLCRRVLSLTKTGIDYSTLTTNERAVLHRWAVALGSLGPKRGITVRDDEARMASRQAASLLAEMNGNADVAMLARKLRPDAGTRPPVVVLSAFGFRVYEGAALVVDAGDDLAVGDRYSWYVSDRYSELADRNPDTWLLDD
jgi:hypothetical protein